MLTVFHDHSPQYGQQACVLPRLASLPVPPPPPPSEPSMLATHTPVGLFWLYSVKVTCRNVKTGRRTAAGTRKPAPAVICSVYYVQTHMAGRYYSSHALQVVLPGPAPVLSCHVLPCSAICVHSMLCYTIHGMLAPAAEPRHTKGESAGASSWAVHQSMRRMMLESTTITPI